MGNKIVEVLSAMTSSTQDVTSDIEVLNFTIVNACLVGNPGDKAGEWVLVDTRLENSADLILQAVEKRFGKDSRPQAIF